MDLFPLHHNRNSLLLVFKILGVQGQIGFLFPLQREQGLLSLRVGSFQYTLSLGTSGVSTFSLPLMAKAIGTWFQSSVLREASASQSFFEPPLPYLKIGSIPQACLVILFGYKRQNHNLNQIKQTGETILESFQKIGKEKRQIWEFTQYHLVL